jgi:signal transduction histidine kinase
MTMELPRTMHALDWQGDAVSRHVVQFYESDDYLLDMLARFAEDTLQQGEACVVVATSAHLDGLSTRLSDAQIDVAGVIDSGQFTTLDADDAMAQFIEDGEPSATRFMDYFGDLIRQLDARWPSVRVFGEMVALTAERQDPVMTITIERYWNDLQNQLDFSLCCAYPLNIFGHLDTEALFEDVCEEHSTVLPSERYLTLTTEQERLHAVTELQQKAERLETEISQRNSAERQLRIALEAEREARERAEHALQMRDQFVSIAAHELKTPLTSLLGHTQLMQRWIDNDLETRQDRLESSVNTVARQADKLARMVGRLLDISSLRKGHLLIERQPTDLAVLLRDNELHAHLNDETRNVVIDAPASLIANVDPLRLEQVIVNLLGNAVRFSPEGSEILVSLEKADDGLVEIAVRDHGIGIPVDRQDRIFEPYFQAHTSDSRSGMGMGLFISQQIVHQHGGEILAEFPNDGGTRMVVRLPL